MELSEAIEKAWADVSKIPRSVRQEAVKSVVNGYDAANALLEAGVMKDDAVEIYDAIAMLTGWAHLLLSRHEDELKAQVAQN